MCDLHVLRIVERVAIQCTDLAFGTVRILPNQISQPLCKVLINARATSGLKKRAVLLIVLPVKIGDQRFRRELPARAGLTESIERNAGEQNETCGDQNLS